MLKFYIAIEALKTDLLKLSRSVDFNKFNIGILTSGIEGLEKPEKGQPEFSQKTFIAPEFLSSYLPTISVDNFASEKEADLYTKNVLRAAWNIADYASMNAWWAIRYGASINRSFDYMDATRVPKIFNNQTYAIGLVLQTFLAAVLEQDVKEELDSYFPASLLASADSLLRNFKTILDKRLAFYDAHREVTINQTIKWIKDRNGREAAAKQLLVPFDQKLQAINECIAANEELIVRELTTDVQFYEDNLIKINTLIHEFQLAVSQAQIDLGEWNTENTTLGFPVTVTASPLIIALSIENHDQTALIKHAQDLFNTKEPVVLREDIKPHLDRFFTTKSNSLNSELKLIQDSVEAQKQQLEIAIASSKELAVYEQKLNIYVRNLQCPQPPQIIIDYNNKTVGPVKDNMKTYMELVDQAKIYKQQVLVPFKEQLLKEKVSLGERFPISDTIPQMYLSQFKQKADQIIQAKLDNNQLTMKQIDDLQAQVTNELREAQDAIDKATAENRVKKLQELEAKISTLKIEIESDPSIVNAENELTELRQTVMDETEQIHSQFQQSIQSLQDEVSGLTSAIQDKEQALKSLIKDQASRKEFLSKAQGTLKNYQEVLNNHTGPYVPSSAIPKDTLNLYLECSKDQTKQNINEVYEVETKGKSLFGLNTTNLLKNIFYYTSSEEDLELGNEWNQLIPHIDAKLSVIEKELAIADKPVNELEEQPNEYLTDKNLWLFKNSYVIVENEKKGLEEKREEIQLQLKNAISQRDTQIAVLNQKMSQEYAKALTTDIALKIKKFEYEVTRLEKNTYDLEFKVDAIKEAQKSLNDIADELQKRDGLDALTYFESRIEDITRSKFDSMMAFKKDAADNSCNELTAIIGEQLSSFDKKEDDFLLSQANDEANIPKDLKTRIEELNQLRERLKTKKDEINKNLVSLKDVNQKRTQVLYEKKEQLIALNQLKQLQQEMLSVYPQLETGQEVALLQPQERTQFINKLAELVSKQCSLLNNFNTRNCEDLILLHKKLCQWKNQIIREHTLQRLLEIEADTDYLLSRFPPRIKSELDYLTINIGIVNNRDATYIDAIKYPVEDPISSKVRDVKVKRLQMNENYDSVKHNNYPTEYKNVVLKRQYYNRLDKIKAEYFGRETYLELKPQSQLNSQSSAQKVRTSFKGVFQVYLEERHAAYWFSDFCSYIGSLVFGILGYKTESQIRGEYIEKTLRNAYDTYLNADDASKTTSYGLLMGVIQQGLDDFPARKDGYEDSMQSKLELFKAEVTKVHALTQSQNLDQQFNYQKPWYNLNGM